MHLPSALSALAAISLLVSSTAALPHQDDTAHMSHTDPIGLTRLFTVTVNVGHAIAPIPIPGGIRLVDQYGNGTVVGPAFNGTILGGVGTPAVYGGGAVTVPSAILYGKTDDGVPFFVQQAGNGNPTSIFSRIQLEIGGKYANYSNDFILGTISESADSKIVTAIGYVPALQGEGVFYKEGGKDLIS